MQAAKTTIKKNTHKLQEKHRTKKKQQQQNQHRLSKVKDDEIRSDSVCVCERAY